MKFVYKGKITGKKVGDKITIQYSMVLNGTTSNTGVNNLPFFTTTISDNGKVLKIIDGRKTTTTNISVLSTKNTYQAQTDNGIITFTVKASKVKKRVDLAITKVKKVKTKDKSVVVYKVTIKNIGTKKSKKTILTIQHIRKNGYKSKKMVKKVKALKPGQKVTYKITFFHDNNHHKYCYKQVFIVNPKKTQNEVTYKNNKKVLKG